LVANVHRPDAMSAATKAAQWIVAKGATVAVEPETARQVSLPVVSAAEFGQADLVVAFGGDGTLIRAAQLCSETGAPILGVYYGRFGFVTQCTSERLESCLEEFFTGNYKIESRLMLESCLLRGGQPVATLHALNESIVQRTVNAPMLTFQVTVDGYVLTRYPADGVIVSTPTGSTAYNLSVGGPIVDPTVQLLMLSAIAPHTLSSRSLILSADSEIGLSVQEIGGDCMLSADGQARLHILSGDEVRIRKSNRVTNLITVDRDDFLIKLGRRLLWNKGLFGDD
jgi:NAD+ kinase